MTTPQRPFDSPVSHGFLRVAVAVPCVAPAEPAVNLERTLELAEAAAREGASLVLFPELGLSGYSIGDLLQQGALLAAVEAAIDRLLAASRALAPVLVVGAPLVLEGRLFNVALVVHRGRLLGLVPKSYLPNYREFYEARHFTPAEGAWFGTVRYRGSEVPFGAQLLFAAKDVPGFAFHVEICEDFWVPVPPSSLAALGGASVLCNLSASNVTVAKADYRRMLVASQSGRTVAAYLYAAAGYGESTTDLAWDGHGLVAENGTILAETERFAREGQLLLQDLDLERLVTERMRTTSFGDNARAFADRLGELVRVELELDPQAVASPLRRRVERFPYVPADLARRDERCAEVYEIQVQGLARRLEATGLQTLVIGVSGGLDSTQALLVAVQTMDRLGLPRTGVRAYTLPGFATTDHTHANAWKLMRALGVTAGEIDIRPSCLQMLRDLGHPAAEGQPVYDATYENVQAGERTSHLFRLANLHGGLVVGTGDLSELALGWTTYGVGDHMSHYGVNGSVPKTLIRHLIAWQAEQGRVDAATAEVLRAILATPISPELVPGQEGGLPVQRTEEAIGPYELQDFHLYYLSRYGFRPSRIAFLAHEAWRGVYDLPTIKRWLRVFLLRFIQTAQFKRSALPDGPKVGSGGSLSPRGDWRAPSDVSAAAWLEELEANVPG